MSNASSSKEPWNPWLGAGLAIFLFLAAQVVAGVLISLYPLIRGWTTYQEQAWLDNSLNLRLAYLALVSVFLLGCLRIFLKWYKCGFSAIGLRRLRASDLLYSLAAFPIYVLLFVLTTSIVKYFVPELDVGQAQDLGFNGVYSATQLVFIAIGLVILPPITEEIIFRGLLYGSLRKAMPVLAAAIVTSLLFAVGHLPEGSGSSPLYIAAIDTFVLSMILVYLREKTGGLWASIGLHAIKNGIAFVTLFLLHAR